MAFYFLWPQLEIGYHYLVNLILIFLGRFKQQPSHLLTFGQLPVYYRTAHFAFYFGTLANVVPPAHLMVNERKVETCTQLGRYVERRIN